MNNKILAKSEVDLIAQGYEWMCPECKKHNTVIEIVDSVICKKCFSVFMVRDFYHAQRG